MKNELQGDRNKIRDIVPSVYKLNSYFFKRSYLEFADGLDKRKRLPEYFSLYLKIFKQSIKDDFYKEYD